MRLYRLDTFAVPNHVLSVFMERVEETHALLRVQVGFVQDLVLEQPGEHDDVTRIATLVEWSDTKSMRRAREAVAEMRGATGFDPAAFMTEHGIEGDFGTYRARLTAPAMESGGG